MAEVYGEKPKIFTKEWWPYYWLYYKWHTIAVLFVAVLIITALVECATKERYDLRLTYLGHTYYEYNAWDDVETALEAGIADADNNGEKNIDIMSLAIIDNVEYMEQNSASYLKHDAEASDVVMYLFIYDKTELDVRMEEDFVSKNFLETDKWLDAEIPSESLVYDGNSESYAVSLKDSSVLKEAGIDCENLYLLMKDDTGLSEKNDIAHENAVIVANKLIK